jgi:hypothetical protein
MPVYSMPIRKTMAGCRIKAKMTVKLRFWTFGKVSKRKTDSIKNKLVEYNLFNTGLDNTHRSGVFFITCNPTLF